ncbi:hypothetical protein JTE90_006616 [Oedothorax gibbosus]|uniref:Secreted protein n=1 Tax=Oedothorax gibbosus TaxID=931172 RepID=A0AAV6U6X3_9ARAC|nr:hypothetical protein JTE90_006616 [Oedothorax gibbosus]
MSSLWTTMEHVRLVVWAFTTTCAFRSVVLPFHNVEQGNRHLQVNATCKRKSPCSCNYGQKLNGRKGVRLNSR